MVSRRRSLDVALATAIAILAVATVMLIVLPDFHGRVVAPAVDLMLDTVALVVTTSVSILAFVRYRERREPNALYQSAAFLALATANAMAVTVALWDATTAAQSLATIGQAQFFVWAFARMLAGILLVVGGTASLRGRRPGHPRALLITPPLLVLAVIVATQASPDVDSTLLMTIQPVVDAPPRQALSLTVLGSTALIVEALVFIWAALLTRRLWLRDGSIGDAYVAIGLVFAAFGLLQSAIFPSAHPQEVASGDLLWLVFGLALLLAIQAEARDTLGALRRANETLERLRDSEVDRAALEERARLSRELHDGLAQDLWLAKLKADRLAALPDLGPEATVLSGEIRSAIDSGLADARQAVMALRIAPDGSDGSLCELLNRYADDYQDRFGLRVEVECDGALPRLRTRVEAELLRIAQEALSNVRRHADATLVMVQTFLEEDQLILLVWDNGRGFEPETVAPGGFGLSSMRERAGIIGGHLSIESRPSDGTSVRVAVPIVPGVGADGAPR